MLLGYWGLLDFSSIRRLRSLSRIFLCLFAFAANSSFGADTQPIERRLDDESIIGRVQLIGVIVDGSHAKAGIAVIKDSETGKSYAIKTGDSLPGVNHLVLAEVQRDGVIFSSDSRQFQIRPYIGSTDTSIAANGDKNVESEETKTDEQTGVGLFEKWASGENDRGHDLLSSEALKNLRSKYKSSAKENSQSGLLSADDSEKHSKENLGISDDVENKVIEDDDLNDDEL